MSKKLRKTWGDAQAPSTLQLKALISAQDKAVIRRWSLWYARVHMLPLYERLRPGDQRVRMTLDAAEGYLAGRIHFRDVKAMILHQCHAAARALDEQPAAQAAVRACAQAASVVHASGHSLGLLYYGAAAIGYDRLGLQAEPVAYQAVAEALCLDLISTLRSMANPEEGID